MLFRSVWEMESFGWVAMWLAKTEGSLIKEEQSILPKSQLCKLSLRKASSGFRALPAHSKENLCVGWCTHKEMRLRMEKRPAVKWLGERGKCM